MFAVLGSERHELEAFRTEGSLTSDRHLEGWEMGFLVSLERLWYSKIDQIRTERCSLRLRAHVYHIYYMMSPIMPCHLLHTVLLSLHRGLGDKTKP